MTMNHRLSAVPVSTQEQTKWGWGWGHVDNGNFEWQKAERLFKILFPVPLRLLLPPFFGSN